MSATETLTSCLCYLLPTLVLSFPTALASVSLLRKESTVRLEQWLRGHLGKGGGCLYKARPQFPNLEEKHNVVGTVVTGTSGLEDG